MKLQRIAIVGAGGGANLGGAFMRGARELGLVASLIDQQRAFEGPAFWRKICWHLLDHRAPRQQWFSRQAVDEIRGFRAEAVVFTGQSPIASAVLDTLRKERIFSVVYLSDDPFNPTHHCRWFMRLLPAFDRVCTPRRANMDDLRNYGARQVTYVPFGVDPELFFPPPLPISQVVDVFFAGGADAGRAAMIGTLHKAGLTLGLYGSYWDRYSETRGLSRGQCGVEELREAAWRSRVTLCVVRKANRDGHCMRTFELPAMRCCMLVEDTEEHREIFGEDGAAVVYFQSNAGMVDEARRLVQDAKLRERLATAAHDRIRQGGHTYADRLRLMLACD